MLYRRHSLTAEVQSVYSTEVQSVYSTEGILQSVFYRYSQCILQSVFYKYIRECILQSVFYRCILQVQSVYSTECILHSVFYRGLVSVFCRGAVSVFYSPSWLGKNDLWLIELLVRQGITLNHLQCVQTNEKCWIELLVVNNNSW